MSRTHVLSHDSSARARGLALLRPRRDLVHVTRPGVGGARTEHGVKHHLYRLFNHVEYLGDLPVHDLARTVLDIAREHGVEAGVVAIDQALARGVPWLALMAALAEMSNWPYVTRARESLTYADGGAESPGESLTRLLLLGLGHGVPETQFPVPLGDRVAWVDLRIGRHLIEFDGKIKYLTPDRGGVAVRPVEDILWEEKVREREICRLGFGMSRVVWGDLMGQARALTAKRLDADIAETRSRFGVELPDPLAQFAARMRGRRRLGRGA